VQPRLLAERGFHCFRELFHAAEQRMTGSFIKL
jgi:hypothetical protein